METIKLNHSRPTRGRLRLRGRFVLVCGFAISAGLLAACDADFVDLRSATARTIAAADAGVVIRDAGGGDDDVEIVDGAAILAIGPWGGRADYAAAGQASIIRRDNGDLELQLSDDFVVDRVPGPVVVLSYRPSIGSEIDPAQGDVELGRLESNRGAQTYALPAGVDDRTFVWVYCKPFGLEVGRAELEAQ